ncbi:MAG: hypothetical protein E5Y29_02435, partial [Mesorhizobium sp.]
ALRDRLRSADIWVDGSRSFRPIGEHLMPRSTFTILKDEDRLGLGVQPHNVLAPFDLSVRFRTALVPTRAMPQWSQRHPTGRTQRLRGQPA